MLNYKIISISNYNSLLFTYLAQVEGVEAHVYVEPGVRSCFVRRWGESECAQNKT